MSIGKKASKGFTSFLYRNMLEKAVGLLAMAILARKLTPYDFGLVSITDVLIAIISVFGATGLAEFLLAYRKDDVEDIFRSSFWFNLLVAVSVSSVFLISAPIWSYYQKEPRIVNISYLSVGVYFFSQLQVIPKAWLSKNLQFDKQVKIQAPFILLIALGKVIAAYCGLGVYSLLIPTLLLQPLQTWLMYRSMNIKFNFHFETHRWKEIYKFTKHIIGASLLARLADHGDKIILSKFFGLSTLGIYNIAYQLADLITSQLVTVSNLVLSSVLPKYADDPDKMYAHYINFLKVFAFLLFPAFGILFIIAKPAITFIYGAQWVSSALPMQILIIYSIYRTVTSSCGSIMNTLHKNKERFKLNLIYTPFHLVGSFVGAHLGIVGLATSVVVVKCTFLNFTIKQMMDALKKPFGQWYKDLLPYFQNTVIITGCLSLIIYYTNLFQILSPFTAIFVSGISFILIYYFIFGIFYQQDLKRLSAFIGLVYPKSQTLFNFLFRI